MTVKLTSSRIERKGVATKLIFVALSLFIGVFLTATWSYQFVDSVIGDTILRTLLGESAAVLPITGTVAGALFAFASGIAGTFTACNVCVFSALVPMTAKEQTFKETLRPLLYLSIGLILVSGIYGAIGALWGPSLPQLSQETLGDTDFPLRLAQSTVVFVSLGFIMIVWGLTALKLIPNPFAAVTVRHSWLPLMFMGGLIGAFLIGRPFPPFRKMFAFAAATQDPLYGAFVFILQAFGNIIIMVALFLLLRYGTGGRFERWLHNNPTRLQIFTAVVFITGGTFFVTYWGMRVPAIFNLSWWPF